MTADENTAEPETSTIDAATRAAPLLAWSLVAESDEPQRQPPRSVWGIVGVIAACSLVAAGVTGIVVWLSRPQRDVPPAPPTAQPTVTPSVSAAPVPAPVPSIVKQTISATPTATVPVSPEDRDARFTALLMQQHLPPIFNDRPVEAAQGWCRSLAEGEYTKRTAIATILRSLNEVTLDQATFYMNAVVETYCPQYN